FVDAASHDALVGAVQKSRFLGDKALLKQFQHRHVESLPAERPGSFDDFVESLSFGLAVLDRIFYSKVCAHDFQRGDSASGYFREQALRHDPAYGFGKSNTDLLFFRLLEHADDAVEGLAGIDRMQRTHHQMAGFGG